MKFFSLIIFLFSISSNAQVSALEGLFLFNGEVTILSHKINKNIYVANDEGKKNLEDLKKQGYQCNVLTSVMYVCSKFLDNTSLDTPVVKDLIEKNKELSIEFGLAGGQSLESQGDSLSVWNVNQQVKLGVEQAEIAKYYKMRDFSKVSIEFVGEKVWFNVYSDQSIAQPIFLRLDHDKFSSESYFIELVLKKN